MDNKHRRKKYLLPYTSSQSVQAIPPVRLSEHSLSVQSSTVWCGGSALHFHQNCKGDGSSVPSKGDSVPPLHRRLADRSRLPTESSRSRETRHSVGDSIGLDP